MTGCAWSSIKTEPPQNFARCAARIRTSRSASLIQTQCCRDRHKSALFPRAPRGITTGRSLGNSSVSTSPTVLWWTASSGCGPWSAVMTRSPGVTVLRAPRHVASGWAFRRQNKELAYFRPVVHRVSARVKCHLQNILASHRLSRLLNGPAMRQTRSVRHPLPWLALRYPYRPRCHQPPTCCHPDPMNS